MRDVRFALGGRTYSASADELASLRFILRFDAEAAAMGLSARYADIEQASQEMRDLTDDEIEQHPKAKLVLAYTIWAARLKCGDDLTFEQAIDFPLPDLTFPPSPEDRARPTKARKGKRKGKRKPGNPAKSSGPVAEPPEADVEPTTPAI